MSITECIEEYVKTKREAGLYCNYAAGILSRFANTHRGKGLDEVTEQEVTEYLESPSNSDSTWQNKYGALKGVFEYWKPRYPLQTIPMPRRRRILPQRFLVPHIYLPSEIERLIYATRNLKKSQGFIIDPRTFRTLLLVIYGAGCSTGEARDLSLDDIDLKRRQLNIRNGRRARRIPVCVQLHRILETYMRSRLHRRDSSSTNLFLTRTGIALTSNVICQSFRSLRRSAAVPMENDRNPSLRDFVPTFAVQRLSEWHKRGLDLEKMVPALAAYMGYASRQAIERYLRFTPEYFQKQLNMICQNGPHMHWRDDPALMSFLSST
jgi:integrase/recombinase XerD